MKALRRIVILIFLLSVGVFAFSRVKALANKKPPMPVISSTSDRISVPCAYTEEEMLQGLTAKSEKDGDLTDQIMVGSISRFKSKGVSTVTYVVFDSFQQPGTYTREVEFTDYRSPEFTLSSPLVFEVGGTNGIDSYVGATDIFFGNINNAVRFEDNNISFNAVGDYYLTVEATNGYGDSSELSLPVHLIDTKDMVLQVELNENIIYLPKGTEDFSPSSYVRGVILPDGSELGPAAVSCRSSVDTEIAGVYEVKYTASYSGDRGVTWLTVVVYE